MLCKYPNCGTLRTVRRNVESMPRNMYLFQPKRIHPPSNAERISIINFSKWHRYLRSWIQGLPFISLCCWQVDTVLVRSDLVTRLLGPCISSTSTPQCACLHEHIVTAEPAQTDPILFLTWMLSFLLKKTEQIHKSCSNHLCRGDNFDWIPATKISPLPWN